MRSWSAAGWRERWPLPLLAADLVVDAAGRGSWAPQWLGRLGLPAVAEDRVDWAATFASCLFRAPAGTAAAPPIVMLQPDFCASGPLRAATDPTLTGGDYVGPGGRWELHGPPVRVRAATRVCRPEAVRRLWEASERLSGVSYPCPDGAPGTA